MGLLLILPIVIMILSAKQIIKNIWNVLQILHFPAAVTSIMLLLKIIKITMSLLTQLLRVGIRFVNRLVLLMPIMPLKHHLHFGNKSGNAYLVVSMAPHQIQQVRNTQGAFIFRQQ